MQLGHFNLKAPIKGVIDIIISYYNFEKLMSLWN